METNDRVRETESNVSQIFKRTREAEVDLRKCEKRIESLEYKVDEIGAEMTRLKAVLKKFISFNDDQTQADFNDAVDAA